MNTPRKLAALIGAGALVLAVSGTVAAVTDYATVSGHVAFSSDANKTGYWGDNCTKLEDTDFGSVDSYVLAADYGKVIVKAGSGTYANTVFDNPTAGQTVWADTNGDNTFNPGGPGGDKNISHIIFCDEASSSSSTSSSTSFSQTEESSTDSQSSSSTWSSSTTSFSETQSDTTDSQSSSSTASSSTSFSQTESDTTAVTQPPTDTIGGTGTRQQSSGTWLLIASLGVLLGSVIVLAPSRAKTRE